jgi:hypothetical protein
MATITATDSSSLQFSVNGASSTILKNHAQTFVLGPEEYRIIEKGFLIKDFELWTGYALLASARKETFSYAGGTWKLRCSPRRREIEYSLYQGKNLVGSIRSTTRPWESFLQFFLYGINMDFREIDIDLPEEFPAVVQVFLTWVACYRWTNVDGATSGE